MCVHDVHNESTTVRGLLYSTVAACERKKDLRDREQDEQDLKWRFSKVAKKKGVYRDFGTLPSNQPLVSQ